MNNSINISNPSATFTNPNDNSNEMIQSVHQLSSSLYNEDGHEQILQSRFNRTIVGKTNGALITKQRIKIIQEAVKERQMSENVSFKYLQQT